MTLKLGSIRWKCKFLPGQPPNDRDRSYNASITAFVTSAVPLPPPNSVGLIPPA
jgi:hypothetical protein